MVLADDLALKTATIRVARLLRERARAEGRREGARVRLSRAGLREDEIAAMVGAVRVHVSRSLRALARMGAITLDRDAISIPDMTVLDALLNPVELDERRTPAAVGSSRRSAGSH